MTLFPPITYVKYLIPIKRAMMGSDVIPGYSPSVHIENATIQKIEAF